MESNVAYNRTIWETDPANPHKPPLRVLFADGSYQRSHSFGIKEKGYVLRFAVDQGEAESALTNIASPWDVVFYSSYMGDWKYEGALLRPLVDAHKRGMVKGVIITTPIPGDARKACEFLSAEKVPVVWVPFGYNDNNRTIKPWTEIKKVIPPIPSPLVN